MPIVNHRLESTTQADGSTQNILRMYDQDAREYTTGWSAPVGFDNQTKVNLVITEMNEQLAESEFNQIVGQAE